METNCGNHADGRIVTVITEDSASSRELEVVVNWFAELERLAAHARF